MAEAASIVFMGTPAFGAIVLGHLLKAPDLAVAGVFTKPDGKSGRGLKPWMPEVKRLALEAGLPVWQPASLRGPEAAAIMDQLKPDFIVSASYGLILPQNILDAAAIAPLNVHASLLPRYRGAAPIQRAIMENWGPDAKTGVSIMKMEAGLDTGPVYATLEVPIGRKGQLELSAELAEKGGALLVETIRRIISEKLSPIPQDHARATVAARLNKEDGAIDWTRPALEVDALIRAATPWPGASATLEVNGREIPISILSGRPLERPQGMPGELAIGRSSLAVACGDGWYEIAELKQPGGKAMPAAAFLNGLRSGKQPLAGRALA